MKGTYKLTPLAQLDLEDIWVYSFENWSRFQADKYYAEIIEVFEAIASGYIMGRKVDIRKGYHKTNIGRHVVYYKVSDRQFDIIRILHDMMDVNRHL